MIILGTNSIKDTGYDVANSLRFENGSSDYLNRSTSSGNQRTFTYSNWVKYSLNASDSAFFSSGALNNDLFFQFNSSTGTDERLQLFGRNSGSAQFELMTTQLFRDPSAWYHIVVAFDTTQGTASNRIKIYVNGNQITNFDITTYPSQNTDIHINESGGANFIGNGISLNYFSGYIAEAVLVDGQALTPTSFGEFDEDSGIWKPIDVSGLTFGNNGFYLDFENSGALGADVSGNSNNFTVNNLTAIDQSTDTCTNNFATMNPLNSVGTGTAFTLSEGNLKATSPNSGQGVTQNFGSSSTIGVTSGKWYLEAKATVGAGGYSRNAIGISGEVSTQARSNTQSGSNSVIYYDSENGNKSVNGSGSSYGASYATNDIIGIAIDLDSGTKTVTFYKNGSSQGAITIPTAVSSTTDGAYFIYQGDTSGNSGTTSTFEFNFGSPPYAISSGNTDGNGYGNFEYAVPSGYYSLNTKNLSEFG